MRAHAPLVFPFAARSAVRVIAALLLASFACTASLPREAFGGSTDLDCPANFEPDSPCAAASGPGDAGSAPGANVPAVTFGNPASLVTGIKRQSESDYAVAGAALGFTRHYASADVDANAGLGQGWRHTYLVELFATGSGGRLVVDSRGRHVPFDPPVGNGLDGTRVRRARLTSDGHLLDTGERTVWVVPDGRRLSFQGSYLVRIDWPDRRHLALHYRQRRLASVTDETGRALAFEYTSGATGRGGLALRSYDPEPHRDHAGHLAALVLPGGERIEYDYDERRNLTRARFPDGTSRDYHYADPIWPSHLTALTERTGTRIASWTYDERGRVASSSRADGVERVGLSIEAPEDRAGAARGAVGDEGRTVVTDSGGARSVYRWRRDPRSGLSQLLSGTGPGCASCPPTGWRHAYDAAGQLTRSERLAEDGRPLGTRRLEYDARGRLVRLFETLVGPGGRAVERTLERREYDGHSHRVRFVARPSVNRAGERTTETVYGPDGLPEAIVERGFSPRFPLSVESSSVPRSGVVSGAPVAADGADEPMAPAGYDPVVRVTRFVREAGRLVAVDGPREDVEDVTRLEWDERGRLVAIRPPAAPALRVTRFDAHGRAAEFRVGERRPFTLERDVDGRVIVARQGELVVRYVHDAEGRLLSVTDTDGRVTRLARDAAGRLAAVTDALGRTRTIERDDESRVTGHAAFGLDGSLIRSIGFLFDADGDLASITERRADATGTIGSARTLDHARDATGLALVATDRSNGATSRAVTDSIARTLRLVEPDGLSSAFTFDVAGHEIAFEDARGNETRYPRDDFGRIVLLDSPDGGRAVYRHDAAGNRVEAHGVDGRLVRYTHDAAGRPISRIDADGTTRWRWDEGAGTLLEVSNPTSTARFEYDAESRLVAHVREIDGHRFETRYRYDARGRLIEKRLPDGQILHHHYHESGANRGTLRAITRERWLGFARETIVADVDLDPRDGASGYLALDGARRLATFAPNGEIHRLSVGGTFAAGYRFDDSGRIVAIEEGDAERRYGYVRGRLSSASTPVGEFRYTYDAAGNRLSRTVSKGGHLLHEERHSYAAAGKGNRLLGSVDTVSGTATDYRHDAVGAPVGDGVLTYTRDANGRQTAIHRDGRILATYAYNAFGERVKKVVHTAGEAPRVTYFLYDGRALVAEADERGSLTAQYVYLDGHRPVARIADRELHAIHTDHLGAPRAMTDRAGRRVWRADYTPFGEALIGESELDLPLRLPGQYADAETGTHANYLRDYDPRTGRYTTPDPIGLEGGANLYAYVSGNPLGATDPLGLFELALTPEAERLIRELGLERSVNRALQPASQPIPPPRPGPPVSGVLRSMVRVTGLAALAATSYELGYQGAALLDALVFQPADHADLVAQIRRYDPDYRPMTEEVSARSIRDLAADLYGLQLEHLATFAGGGVCAADPQLYTDTYWAVAQASNEPGLYVSPEGVVFPSRDAYRVARFNYDAAGGEEGTGLSFGEWYARESLESVHSSTTGHSNTETTPDGKTPWSGRGLVAARIPFGWGEGKPNRSGEGHRWQDPENQGNGVRVDRGDPDVSQPTQQVDHVVVRHNGRVIGRDGKPITGSIADDPINAHIPLLEYLTWKTWHSP